MGPGVRKLCYKAQLTKARKDPQFGRDAGSLLNSGATWGIQPSKIFEVVQLRGFKAEAENPSKGLGNYRGYTGRMKRHMEHEIFKLPL